MIMADTDPEENQSVEDSQSACRLPPQKNGSTQRHVGNECEVTAAVASDDPMVNSPTSTYHEEHSIEGLASGADADNPLASVTSSTTDTNGRKRPRKRTQDSRKRSAVYSRRNYYKTKARYEELRTLSYELRAEQEELLSESHRLENLVESANTVVRSLPDKVRAEDHNFLPLVRSPEQRHEMTLQCKRPPASPEYRAEDQPSKSTATPIFSTQKPPPEEQEEAQLARRCVRRTPKQPPGNCDTAWDISEGVAIASEPQLFIQEIEAIISSSGMSQSVLRHLPVDISDKGSPGKSEEQLPPIGASNTQIPRTKEHGVHLNNSLVQQLAALFSANIPHQQLEDTILQLLLSFSTNSSPAFPTAVSEAGLSKAGPKTAPLPQKVEAESQMQPHLTTAHKRPIPIAPHPLYSAASGNTDVDNVTEEQQRYLAFLADILCNFQES